MVLAFVIMMEGAFVCLAIHAVNLTLRRIASALEEDE